MTAVTDASVGVKVKTITQAGPASYSAGGFVVDFSATHVWLGFVQPVVKTAAGTLPGIEYEVALNRDASGVEALGKVAIKVLRNQYQKGSSGSVTGQPGGVTVQSALSNNSATTHTHDFTHSHAPLLSGTGQQAGAGSNSAASPDADAHVHQFTPGTATVTTTPAGGSHSHPRPFEYDHNHAVTTTVTDVSLSEVAGGTDLSGTTWLFIGYGFGAT